MAAFEWPTYNEWDKIRTFIEKVNTAYQLSKVKNVKYIRDVKCNKVALDHNVIGDDMLHAKKFLKAVECFTQAIANAQDGSCEMAAAYAGRADALVSLEYYKEALEDFDRAVENPCSAHIMKRIQKRRAKAERMLPKQPEPIDDTPPEIPDDDKHRTIKCASKAVELKEDAYYGRHVVAARDIKIGELLAVEKPYVTIILPTQEMLYCAECLAPCLNLLPCQNCTQIMFCSKGCRKLATKKYHKYECDILKTMRAQLTRHPRVALKLILKHKKILENVNAYRLESNMYCSDRFWEILNLTTNSTNRDSHGEAVISYESAAVYHIMKKYTNFFDEFPSSDSHEIFKGLIMKLSQISSSNFHSIYNLFGDDPDDDVIVATGGYPFLSLLNHSCAPNVFRINIGKNMILLANTEIKQGEQLFDDYGVHYYKDTKEERHAKLMKQYFFTCHCVACANDWPTLPNLECVDPEAHEKMVDVPKFIFHNRDNSVAIRNQLDEVLKIPRDKWTKPSCEVFLLEDCVVQAYLRLFQKKRVLK